ncbi:MAG: GAF domain-containing protein [Anaerolineae bacterium]|nr:GAF domain-containing protein [Anaerolineae bacterium]
MSDTIKRQILVIAGDYEVLQRTQQALKPSGWMVRGAFSHRDALHIVEHESVDLALVDAALFDRLTGEYTIQALQQSERVPLVVFAAEGMPVDYVQPPVEMVIGGLDERTIWRSMMAVLGDGANHQIALPDYDGEVETFFSLSKSLTEVLDLSEVLNRVVGAARRLTGAEEGMILLPDDEAGRLYLRARVGIDDEVAQNFRIKTDDTLAGQVFNSAQPVLIGAQGPQKVKTQYFVNSLLYVPILLKGTAIGVLGVNNKTGDNEFTQRHLSLLSNLASYAAVAIENARVHEETLERTRELQTLVEASEFVNASVALYETLPNICMQLVRVLNVGWSAIMEWLPETSQLRVMVQYQHAVWRAGHGPTEEVRRAVLDQEYTQVNRGDAEHMPLPAGVHTMLLIPVRADGQVLGLVRSFYVEAPEQPPSSKMIQQVKHLGLEGLMVISTSNGQTPPAQVLRMVENVNRHLGADWSELALVPPQGKSLTVQAAAGAGVWLRKPYPVIDLKDYPDLRAVVENQQMLNSQSNGKAAGNGARMLLESTRSHAILALPLVQRGQSNGLVLFGDTRYARVFNEREVDMGRAIVAQAATALENARLVHDLEFSLQELKDTQDRLIQTARLSAMGELAAAVAHQINNPLTTILVDTELMLLDEPQDSPNFRSLQAISRAGKRAASVVRRLLATARPVEENAPVEPIDVVDTIEGILSLVRSHIEQDHIRVWSRLPSEHLPHVMAVQGQLDDIWLNLLLNAHDALIGQAGAEIGIEVFYQSGADDIWVYVSDNGPGIPEEIQGEIFKPFFTTKPVGEGTGLGLHICHQVVERIQGSISVESAVGRGTRFLVRLPVKKGND